MISTLEIKYLMIFMTEILYLVFVIFINEAIAQFQTLMHAIVTLLIGCIHHFVCTCMVVNFRIYVQVTLTNI